MARAIRLASELVTDRSGSPGLVPWGWRGRFRAPHREKWGRFIRKTDRQSHAHAAECGGEALLP